MTDAMASVRHFSKEPPTDLALPPSVAELVRSRTRSDYVLAHGFDDELIRPAWWTREGIEIRFPSGDPARPTLTRADLFAMGRDVDADADLLSFVWHVLAWGSGPSRRHNRQRIDHCRSHVPLLRHAFDAARDGDPREAYGSLIRPGRARIPQFGPAFFSKFLYFASEGVAPRCLILDARVARSLYQVGWSIAPTYPKQFSYNWHTDTYVNYCELLRRWAAEASEEVSPDMLERALFEGGAGLSPTPGS